VAVARDQDGAHMKIYTRTGDDGTTGLFGGRRVAKSDPRIECYGTVDELNATLGMAAALAPAGLGAMLAQIQNELFVIGSHLATPQDDTRRLAQVPDLDEGAIKRLESQIDAADAELPALRNFILPGGSDAAARLHLARTVCRRAERLLVAFSGEQAIEPLIVQYLNRLSDWLFVYARWCNHKAGVADVPWAKP
jgi:cob(I)alamin adenosyltransferase